MSSVWAFKKILPSMVAPMEIPRNRVTTLAISFSEALVSRLTTAHSFSRLPSMIVPISGRPWGAISPPITVTAIGKTILALLETGLILGFITSVRSFSDVNILIIGGWITGTRLM